jgi:hypothetical protein
MGGKVPSRTLPHAVVEYYKRLLNGHQKLHAHYYRLGNYVVWVDVNQASGFRTKNISIHLHTKNKS